MEGLRVDDKKGEPPMDEAQKKEWRQNLKVGDVVDARDSEKNWFDAEITEAEQAKVKVHYRGWSPKWDAWVDRDAEDELQPLFTMTENWRGTLEVGSAVEIKDDSDINKPLWYEGKVVQADSEKGLVQVKTVNNQRIEPRWVTPMGESVCKMGTHIKRKQPAAHSTNIRGQSTRGTPPAPGVVGMPNLGNTCFMNSMLQCLGATTPLARYFSDSKHIPELNESNVLGTGGQLARAYGSLVHEMRSGRFTVVSPTELKRTIGQHATQFSGYQEQDSQEFMNFLLDGIHEDLNRVREKPYTKQIESDGRPDPVVSRESWAQFKLRNDSIIVDHCYGQLKSHVTCPVCNHESITFDPYLSLSLPLPVGGRGSGAGEQLKIESCFAKLTEREQLGPSEQWYCSKCKKHCQAYKRLSLWTTPDVLILHLKRFRYSAGAFVHRQKIDAFVQFPIEGLDLSDVIQGPAPDGSGTAPIYDLYAVSEHIGGLGGGHYTAKARVASIPSTGVAETGSTTGSWYSFNDSMVHESQSTAAVTQNAYVLFYMRRGA